MEVFTLIITILLAIVAIVGGIFGILSYRKQKHQAKTQQESLKFQFTQHEERQREQITTQFNKLKEEQAVQKSDSEKNNATINLRLENIERKVDNVEEMHTEIALIKQNSMHIMKSVEAIQGQLTRQADQYATPQTNGTSRPPARRKKP